MEIQIYKGRILWIKTVIVEGRSEQNDHKTFLTLNSKLFTAALALRSRGLVVAWCVFVFVVAICL